MLIGFALAVVRIFVHACAGEGPSSCVVYPGLRIGKYRSAGAKLVLVCPHALHCACFFSLFQVLQDDRGI